MKKLFRKRSLSPSAVGFSYHPESNSVNVATLNRKKGCLELASSFTLNLNCKSALHRLQQLLGSTGSCQVFSSSNCLLQLSSEVIKNLKVAQKTVQNKVEALLDSNQILTIPSSELQKRSPYSFLCIQQKQLQRLEHQELKPGSTICSFQALAALKIKFVEKQTAAFICCFKEERLELCYMDKDEKLCHTFSFETQGLEASQIAKLTEKSCYEAEAPRETPFYYCGEASYQSRVLEIIKAHTSTLKLIHNEALKNYELEYGAALSMLSERHASFKPVSALSVAKLFKRPLKWHSSFAALMLAATILFWSFQQKQIQKETDCLFEQVAMVMGQRKPTTVEALLANFIQFKKQNPIRKVFCPEISVGQTLLFVQNLSDQLPSKKSPHDIVIQELSYNLAKDKKRAGALVKLKLKIASPKLAKEFYTKLQSSPKVNSKGKIKWDQNKGVYTTQFQIKGGG